MEKLLLQGEIPVNCYIIKNEQQCYIIDPGYEKERLQQYVKNNNLTVLGILLTHGHLDHIGALDAFKVPIYVHKYELDVVLDDYINGFEELNQTKPYDASKLNFVTIDENTELSLGEYTIEVIHTPGHTIGSVCFKHKNDLYTGDTLFCKTVGKWIFPTGNLNELQKSIVTLINSQDLNVHVHPAHGKSTTIKDEKLHNEYYLTWSKLI